MTDPSDYRPPGIPASLGSSGLKHLVSCPSIEVAELAAAPDLDESLGDFTLGPSGITGPLVRV
jgi:hypothetical protein